MSIRRADIVAAALDILDQYGLADLTMRRLGERLGVQPGAIYWHLPNKQSVLAAVSDAIAATIPLPDPALSASDWLREWAQSLRATLLQHRDAAELVLSTRATELCHVDLLAPARARMSRESGIASSEVGIGVLLHFVLGSVYEEQTRVQLSELGLLPIVDIGQRDATFGSGVRVVVAGICAQTPG